MAIRFVLPEESHRQDAEGEILQKIPASPNLDMDEMTEKQIHEKLQKGFRDAELGRVRDAKEVFGWLTEKS